MKLSQVAAFALVGLAGCGAHAESVPHGGSPDPAGSAQGVPDAAPAAPPVADGGGALAAVDENLARLRALGLFEVGGLIMTRPHAAERLSDLADAAVKAAATPYAGYACGARIDQNLEIVRSLEVVGVGAFLRAVPANNPSCQDSPCPEDISAADAENERRATVLESVALGVQGI